MPTLSRTSPSSTPRACADLGRDAGVRHRRRVADQRLDAAQALGQAEQLRPRQEPLRRRRRRPSGCMRDHAAEVAHLLRARPRGRGGPAGRGSRPSSTCGCFASQSASSPAFAQCRSMRTASVLSPRSVSQAVERPRHAAGRVLVELDRLEQVLRRRSPRRRPRRSARRGTWSCCGRRGRPRAASGCCR